MYTYIHKYCYLLNTPFRSYEYEAKNVPHALLQRQGEPEHR